MPAVITLEKLTKSMGPKPRDHRRRPSGRAGEVFGFPRAERRRKTTTIRTMLDLIRPTGGGAWCSAIESSADPVAIHRRIGYLPGEFALYDRLTGAQHLDSTSPTCAAGWTRRTRASLVERLDLDPSRKFKEYRQGQQEKVALVIALQHRPELLLLDEPTSGLDPLVQQTFFSILREAVAGGATVFLSSHILSEVEKTADRVGIIREGRLVKVDTVDALRDLAHHQVELRFAGEVPAAAFEALPGVSDVTVEDHVLRLRVTGAITPVVQAAARYELLDFVSREPSLEETFLAQYGRKAVEVG